MKTPNINHYWHPTPVFWRKIGDSLLAVGSLAGTIAIAEDYKWLGLVIAIAGVVGKFLTNFFKE
jgi:hypothetical protein